MFSFNFCFQGLWDIVKTGLRVTGILNIFFLFWHGKSGFFKRDGDSYIMLYGGIRIKSRILVSTVC